MLESLNLVNVGPIEKCDIKLQERLNLITGDNGLGKSFLLDVAWWVLTRKWPRELNAKLTSGYPARPVNAKRKASISFRVKGKGAKSISYTSEFDASQQAWRGRSGRPYNPGLVLHAHADGGFAVWDPARNYWKKNGDIDVTDRLPGFVFSPQDVWDGLKLSSEGGHTTVVCNGLIADWSSWIRENGTQKKLIERILERMSPPGETLTLGELTRVSLDDVRDVPTIKIGNRAAVAVVYASSGVRRVLGLAYMLSWAWREHQQAAMFRNEDPTAQLVLLFDEVESHLHPRWQRAILQSLLTVAESLLPEASVQLIAATHSPLVLASAEPLFDVKRDAWFDLDAKDNRVEIVQRPFVSKGDASAWLTSEAFDLSVPRSKEAETAILAARAVLRSSAPLWPEIEDADKKMREAKFPEHDPFWARWSVWVDDNRPARPAKSKRTSKHS